MTVMKRATGLGTKRRKMRRKMMMMMMMTRTGVMRGPRKRERTPSGYGKKRGSAA
jgi:hypothetical protein